MGIYNEILVGRYGRGLQKLFAIKGSPPVRQIGGELTPVFDCEELTPEQRSLFSQFKYGLTVIFSPTAGNPGAVRLRNPPGSNVVAIFEKVQVSPQGGALSTFFLETQTTTVDLATPITLGSNVGFDTRTGIQGNSKPPLLLLSTQSTPPALSLIRVEVSLNVGTWYDFLAGAHQEIPLFPGDAIQLRTSQVSQPIDPTFWWRERFLEESERQIG
jgi:hypothetical protein